MGRAFEYRKATKFARWDKLAKAFSKASKEISMAIKSGGINPASNLSLRRAIQNAKAVQMPKEKIELAIKRASSKDASDFKELVYEGMAPYGIAIVVETATDNIMRTVADIRSIFKKKGGELGTQGMHDFIFNRKGVYIIPKDLDYPIEELELLLIDYGLEEISLYKKEQEQETTLHYKIIVDFKDFALMQEGLEQINIPIIKSKLDRIPTHTKELTKEQFEQVYELIDTLEQNEDVQIVYHNIM